MKYKEIKPGYKYCPRCELVLRHDEFYTAHGKVTGYCKECHKAAKKAGYVHRRERKESDYLATGAKIVYKV